MTCPNSEQPATTPEEIFRIPGLIGTAEIAVDRFGMAHIRADTRENLFFAQGYNAARDRLWQIDLWRKRGLGLLSADFGPGYLAQDKASRLLLYRGDMVPEWAAYGHDSERICTAFVAGINAYVDQVSNGERPLPPEFVTLGTHPSHWAPADVVRIRSHCLTRNALSEVLRARLLGLGCENAVKLDALRREILPAVPPKGDDALDLNSIPLEVLDMFKLGTATVTFSPDRLAAGLEEAERWSVLNDLGEVLLQAESEGSNNWALDAGHTETGRPLMAMDPHRTHALPSVRYMVHLTMPGLDAIGAGEPSAPGISMGHNGFCAFSITIFGADQEDVHVYETDPKNPVRYRYGDGWCKMDEIEERVEVKGHPDQVLKLRFTHHGPVLYEDPAAGRAYGLRTVWTDPGAAPYMASLAVMKARSHEEYHEALRGWGTPSINHVYADVTGRIAWQTVGATPIRPNWNGLIPVPGDGRYEWAGYRRLEELPSEMNPARGFVTSSNELNLPEGTGHREMGIGYEWIDKSRAERIRAVLGGQKKHGLADSCVLQNDLYSRAAERGCGVIAEARLEAPESLAARSHLEGWDYVLGADSSQAALFEIWMTKHLKPALYTAFGARPGELGLIQPGDVQPVLDLLERPGHWAPDNLSASDAEAPTAWRDAIVDATLAAAWEDCHGRFGTGPEGWRWGAVHRLTLASALAGIAPNVPGFTLEPMDLGGSGSTPMYGNYRHRDFATITGPSVRMVVDVGDWDNSLFINLPGQSGDPYSPHYTDLKADWLGGAYKPMAYRRAAVDAVTESLIRLKSE